MAAAPPRKGAYLDSSAIVKLVVREPESSALRRYLRTRRPYLASALVRAEVTRAVLPNGDAAARQAAATLRRVDLVRINNRVLDDAGSMQPEALRSLDAIHLATALLLGDAVGVVVTYDERMAEAARSLGFTVASPT